LAPATTIAILSTPCEHTDGVFRSRDAADRGVSRNQLAHLAAAGVIERVLSGTYRMSAVAPSTRQRLRAALLWAGPGAAAAGRSAAEIYGLSGVTSAKPEIAVPRTSRVRSPEVIVHRPCDSRALLVRRVGGFPVTGVEPTLLVLGAGSKDRLLEIAFEDARRRRVASTASVRAFLDEHGAPGRPGVAALHRILGSVDPIQPARSVLEVKTRRLLVAHGFTDFVREFPLAWNGRTYRFDFAFDRNRTILETNGRRGHDEPTDYEWDNESGACPPASAGASSSRRGKR